VLPHYSTTLVSTGSRLRLYTVHDDDEPIYYIAKTRPSSAAITSLPTDIVEMIPGRSAPSSSWAPGPNPGGWTSPP